MNNKFIRLLEDSYEAYYWIGFILADAGLHRRRNNIDFSMQLSVLDLEHLKKVAQFLGIDKIKYRRDKKQAYITGQNKIIISKFIEKFGLILPKTYNCPNLEISNKELLICLLIGFIDGDGSINNNSKCKKSVEIAIKLHKNWINFLKIYEELCPHGKISEGSGGYENKQKYPRFRLTYYPEILWLKNKAIEYNLPILNRKWSKVDNNHKTCQEKSKSDKEKIKKLYSEGYKQSEIIKITGFSQPKVSRACSNKKET